MNVAVYVENNGDYKVIFKPGSKIYQDALNALSSKGVHTLYVSSMDRLKFTNHLSDEISHSLSQNLDDEKRILATEHAFNTTHSLIAQTGLNKQTIDMAAATIKSMAKMVSKSKELAKLWHFITSDKGSYLYQNALLSAMIAHEMVVKLEWGKSEEQQQKMALYGILPRHNHSRRKIVPHTLKCRA